MKKLFTLLLFAALLCSLCITGFAEESNSHEKLLEYVPYAAYTGQTETIETQGVSYCTLRIFYKELKQQGLIPSDMKSIDREPSKEALLSFPQVSVEDVCKTFDRLFGPNASRLLKIDEAESGKPILNSMSEQLYLSEDRKTFYYVPHWYGGGDYTLPYGRLFRSEVVGEDLCLYVRMVYTSFDNDLYFWLFETFKREKVLIDYRCDDWDKLGVNPWEMLDNGDFDEYLPVYKHTFKPNGDGTYYWASTVKETDGKQIPISAISSEVSDFIRNTLMAQIPRAAYSGKNENIQSVSWGEDTDYSVDQVLFEKLVALDLLPKTTIGIAKPTISVDKVTETFDQLFGEGASKRIQGMSTIGNKRHCLTLLNGGESYEYTHLTSGESNTRAWYTAHVRTEFSGNDIVLYTRFAETASKNYPIFWISENCKSDENPVLLIKGVEANKLSDELSPWTRLKNGEFDEYLPVYKHTFKPNGDGTYYWAQTELETAGKEIPLSVIDPSAKEENTDTSTAADVSTGSATDVMPQEEGSSAVWIVVAVVAVAAVAAVAVFFVLKKKKA
ncbi:MAG: hypothetical protein IJC19_03730 [Clostridia bacterium]|nr:hypothetical protein [Clostridia bacterium]